MVIAETAAQALIKAKKADNEEQKQFQHFSKDYCYYEL